MPRNPRGKSKAWRLLGNHIHTASLPHLCIRRERECPETPFILEAAKIQASGHMGNSRKQEDKKVGLGSALAVRERGGLNYCKKGCHPGKNSTALEKSEDT